MAFFTNTLATIAAGRRVGLAILVEFDFVEETIRLWDGFGTLVVDALEWQGTGGFGSISGVDFATDDTAKQVTFTLSGVDPTFVALAEDAASVEGRDVTIFGQFLDDAMVPLDDRWTIRSLILDRMGYQANGPTQRIVSVTAETIWTNRNRAKFSFYSDQDQQARFSGDKGCEFIPTLRYKKVPWPIFG